MELVERCCRASHDTRLLAEEAELVEELDIVLLYREEAGLKFFVPHLQCLDLLALSLPRGLGSPTIAENPFNSSLLLLVFGLGPLPRVGR